MISMQVRVIGLLVGGKEKQQLSCLPKELEPNGKVFPVHSPSILHSVLVAVGSLSP
jgi:hypothetical protein